MGTEMKPLDLLVRQGLKAIPNILRTWEKQKLVSGQNKWHKAPCIFSQLAESLKLRL